MIKSVLLSILVAFPVVAQTTAKPNGLKRSCPEVTIPEPPRSMEELKPVLKANNIKVINEVTPANVEHFLIYYNQFPESLRKEMVGRGAKISIMEGSGVTADPSFTSDKTFDGRGWDQVPGSGGEVSKDYNIPTRIVVNHLHDHHGATNLLLHEHAHTLDSLYGRQSLSQTETWSKLLSEAPKSKEFLEMLCTGDYCSAHKDEAFAELFAYYYACETTRKHMEESVPMIADFFKSFTSAKDLLNGKMTVPASPLTNDPNCETPSATEDKKPFQDITEVQNYLKKDGVRRSSGE